MGNVEPHQFQGFSGGVKSAAIGLAGRETINHNHARMIDPRAQLGHYADNPARQDVEEIGAMIGVHLALNAVLNGQKQIVHAVAGEPRAVMEAAIPLSRQVSQAPVAAPFDLVIASAGGHPKDLNLYQAQKALAHAALVTRDGGTVIVVAACPEGTGSRSYEAWMQGVGSHEEVFARFEREPFRVGPHKAFLMSRDAARVRTLPGVRDGARRWCGDCCSRQRPASTRHWGWPCPTCRQTRAWASCPGLRPRSRWVRTGPQRSGSLTMRKGSES